MSKQTLSLLRRRASQQYQLQQKRKKKKRPSSERSRYQGHRRVFMRHNSSLVCMVGMTYECIDTIFPFYGYIFYTHLYCLVECLSIIVLTHAVLGFYVIVCVLYFCICICSAQLGVFHTERCSRNTLIVRMTVTCCTGNKRLFWLGFVPERTD